MPNSSFELCPYCRRAPRYPTGGCSNRTCTNFRLALGTTVRASVRGVIVATHDAHGLSYDIQLTDSDEVVAYVPEQDVVVPRDSAGRRRSR
jgi:hypothetical protein